MKKINSTITIFFITILLTMQADVFAAKGKMKKLYITSIKAAGVEKNIAKRVREGLSLYIFENYSSKYHVLDDDAISAMFAQAEKIIASGCDDTSCMTQIGDAINADEMIHGEVRREGSKLKLVLTNLKRNRKTFSLGVKSKVNLVFPESHLDHFIPEAAEKLINRSYKINRRVDISFSGKVDIRAIKIKKVKGLDISVMKFTTTDDTISNILQILKGLLQQGDAL